VPPSPVAEEPEVPESEVPETESAAEVREPATGGIRRPLLGLIRPVAAHQLRALASLGLWLVRRRDGVGAGGVGFGYSRDQTAMMLLMLSSIVIEGVAVLYLVSWPVLHTIMLVLHVYAVTLTLGLIAAALTRPHVIGGGHLRLRYGAGFDLRVPLELVAGVRIERRIHDGGLIRLGGDLLEIVVGAQTNVTVELSEPIMVTRLLGRPGTASLIRIKADEPEEFVRELGRQIKDARQP